MTKLTQVTAQLNRLRLAPRKVRLVTALLKGKDVVKAISQLEHLMRRSAPYLLKLINSAVASAEHDLNMVKTNLYIKDIVVDEGMKLKRFRAKGYGRTSPLQKKTSHIKILIAERVAGLRSNQKTYKKEEVSNKEAMETKPEAYMKKPEVKTEIGRKKNILGNFGRKIFQRKAI